MTVSDKLEVSYHREMKQNYLMIAAENGQAQSFEARMLEENSIEGLLRFRIRREDDKCWFCYEITSRQPLERLLESKSIGAEQIRTLLMGIAQTLMGMGDYLLAENQILLKPEYIYVYPDNFQPGLCLLPGQEGDFPRQFSSLLQFLLGKADHQDQEAVVLIYGLYRESLKENYGLDNLLQWLLGERHAAEEHAEPSAEAQETEHIGEEIYRAPGMDRHREDKKRPLSRYIMTAAALPILALAALWMWRGGDGVRMYGLPVAGGAVLAAALGIGISLLLGRKRNLGREIREPEETSERKSWEITFAEDETGGREEQPALKRQPDPPADLHTALLWSRDPPEGVHSLKGRDGTAETIPISYYPFLIGKQENLTDYAITHDTISRLHARIDRKGGEYWLTDLNSTNGTAVNGRTLEANETVALHSGDRVDLADMHFLFQ